MDQLTRDLLFHSQSFTNQEKRGKKAETKRKIKEEAKAKEMKKKFEKEKARQGKKEQGSERVYT